MKIFVTLLSVLVSHVAAKSCLDTLLGAWKHLEEGDMKAYEADFADDFILNLDLGEGFDDGFNGHYQYGNDGFNFQKFVGEKLGAYEFFAMEHDDFAIDENRCGYFGEFVYRQKSSGQRYRTKFVSSAYAKDGKMTRGNHWEIQGGTEKLDAVTLIDKTLEAFMTADVDGVNAILHDDIVTEYEGGVYDTIPGYSGSQSTRDEWWNFMGTFSNYVDFHKNANGRTVINYELLNADVNGKSGLYRAGYAYTRKSDGAEFYADGEAIWTFDDLGKMVYHKFKIINTIQTKAAPPSKKQEL